MIFYIVPGIVLSYFPSCILFTELDYLFTILWTSMAEMLVFFFLGFS